MVIRTLIEMNLNMRPYTLEFVTCETLYIHVQYSFLSDDEELSNVVNKWINNHKLVACNIWLSLDRLMQAGSQPSNRYRFDRRAYGKIYT